MKIRINCFGGKLGFLLRKLFPKLCGDAYLFLTRTLSNSIVKKYTEYVNRCQGDLKINVREP